jgi:hypothetical protein
MSFESNGMTRERCGQKENPVKENIDCLLLWSW